MQELDNNIVLPYQEEVVNIVPPTVAREQATYAGELSGGDAISTADNVEFDLSTTGVSSQYDDALDRWKGHQEQVNRDAVIDIISDPNTERDTKLSIVKKFQNNELESTNLRDAYVLDSASEIDTPIDAPVVGEDFAAQQAWIDRVRDNVGFHDQTQAVKTHFDKNLSGSTEGALASIVFDTLAPTDIHSINSARIAAKLGIQVETEDLPIGVQVLGALSPVISNGMFDFARNFIFNGTLSKKMGEAFDSATPEQQLEMMQTITETAGDSFGTDFNKFTALQSAVDPITNPLGVAALDMLGVVGLIPLVGGVVAPGKTLRHFTKLQPDLVSRKLGLNIAEDVPLTRRDEVVTSPQEPTGKGEVNATDSIVTRQTDGTPNDEAVGVADAEGLAKDSRKAETVPKKIEGKVFVQSDQAVARGNNVARISTDKFDELVAKDPNYVAPGNVVMPSQLADPSKSSAPANTSQQIGKFNSRPPESELPDIKSQFDSGVFTITRLDEVDPDPTKPHGAFFSVDFPGFKSPHTDAGSKATRFRVKPNKLLKVETTPKYELSDSNIQSLVTTKGEEFLDNLLSIGQIEQNTQRIRGTKQGKKDLIEVLTPQYPNVNFNQYFDSAEIVMAIGGIEARKAGFDAIAHLDSLPEFSEVVVLNKNVLKQDPISSTSKRTSGLSKQELTNFRKEKLQQFPDEGLKQVASSFHITTEGKNRDTLASDIVAYLEKNSQLSGSKGYKEFSKAFDSAENVKAPEIVVDSSGAVRFEEGSLRYAVMRDKGLKQMALSMGPESMVNAHKHGLITDIPAQTSILDVPELTRVMRPTVPPSSPAGMLAATNPVKAANRYTSAIINQDGTEARHLGTDKLGIVEDSLFSKLDTELNEYYPNIYQKLKLMDKEVQGTIARTETNALVHNPEERARDTELFLKNLQGLQGGVYNQANSTLHMGRVNAEGKALYGRTADYGWDTAEEAASALEHHKNHNPDFPVEVIKNEKSGQFFVQSTWNKPFNQADRWMFDASSMDSSILGVNTSALSRTAFGDNFVFPKTMRGDPEFAKAGLITEYNTSSLESKFFGIVKDEVFATPHKKELNAEFNKVQETGEWIAPHQFASRHPHLKPEEVESLANAYYSLKRGTDYLYDITNIMDRNEIIAQDLKAIVHAEKDGVVAYGKEVNPTTIADDVDVLWDLDTDQAFIMPKKRADGSIDLTGRTVVKTRNPIKKGVNSYEYSIIGAKTQLDAVPHRTLPKIEGWLPRKNTEAWYVRAVPTKLSVNGRPVVDEEILARHFKTVGAGATKAEAEQLVAKMQADFPDTNLKVTEAQENVGDNALADYQLFQDVVRSTKKRGQRLPTINGQSTLEEPVQAFVDSTKILARQFASADHKAAFEQSFMKSFGNFIPAKPGIGKTFPNDVQDLTLPPIASAEEVKRFKVAQRLLVQFKDQRFTATASDTAVRDVMNAGATKLEGLGFMGPEIAAATRELAKVGNLPLRFAKTVTSHLYLYLSSAQWLVQTQQLLELSAIQPSLLTKTFTQVPAISAAILARAPHIGSSKPMANIITKGAQKFSATEKKEFDELVDIIYNSGLPQSVDLNQMLHGTWQKSKFTLDPSAAREAIDGVTNTISLPGKVGKQLGYGPAELAANIGTWLFARDRFIKNNPGADWKGESAVAKITADAWDINHSMSGRSGSMEFQKGALGLALQFFAVQIKGFMQLLSSKTLSTAEKSKLAVARLGIYGMYGVPLGGTAAAFIDQWVDDNGDEDMVNQYQAVKGGMLDATVNTMLDIAHASPKDLDSFIETGLEGAQGKGVHDIKVSERLTPVPNDKLGVPQLTVLNELYEVATGESPNGVRFPFVNAFGSLGKSVQGMMDMWRAADLESPQKVVQSLETFATASSLGNNYNKAQAMQIARDKVGATGSNYGLGEVTLGKIGAQFFGITTREEENIWKTKDIIQAREDGIKERSDEITRVIEKLNLLEPGTFEYDRTIDTMNILIAYTAEGDRNAVRKQVESTIKNRLEEGTMQQHYAERLWNWHADGQSKDVNEALNTLKRNAVRNPKTAELLELINNTGYFKDR